MDPLADFVARHSLRFTGSGFRGHCPICSGTDSLNVQQDSGALVGSCSVCGDVRGIATLLTPANRVMAGAG